MLGDALRQGGLPPVVTPSNTPGRRVFKEKRMWRIRTRFRANPPAPAWGRRVAPSESHRAPGGGLCKRWSEGKASEPRGGRPGKAGGTPATRTGTNQPATRPPLGRRQILLATCGSQHHQERRGRSWPRVLHSLAVRSRLRPLTFFFDEETARRPGVPSQRQPTATTTEKTTSLECPPYTTPSTRRNTPLQLV